MSVCLKKKKRRNVDIWCNIEKFTASYLENKHFPAKNSQSVEVPITDVRLGSGIGRFVTSGWPGRFRLPVILPRVCWRDWTMWGHCWQRSCWWWDPVRWTFKNIAARCNLHAHQWHSKKKKHNKNLLYAVQILQWKGNGKSDLTHLSCFIKGIMNDYHKTKARMKKTITFHYPESPFLIWTTFQ